MKKYLYPILLILITLSIFVACTNPEPKQNSAKDVSFNRVSLEEINEENREKIEENKRNPGYIVFTQGNEKYIAVFAGEKPSSGYEIRIEKIEEKEKENSSIIFTSESKPDMDGMYLTVLTYPVDVARVGGDLREEIRIERR